LETRDFPSGISEIELHWNDFGTEREMKVHARFYEEKQYKDLSLEPAISWAVRDKNSVEANHDHVWVNSETKHRHEYWSPEVIEKLENVAIYDIDRFPSTEASYSFVKERIIESIESNSYSSILDLHGQSVDVLISSDETVIESTCPELEEMVLIEITKSLRALPSKWMPAMANFMEFVGDDYYNEDDEGKIILIPANSLVRFDF
jgi:hypothetical protein